MLGQEEVLVWATGTMTASGLKPLFPDPAPLVPLLGVQDAGVQWLLVGVQGRAPGDIVSHPGYLDATGGTVVGGGTRRGQGLVAC